MITNIVPSKEQLLVLALERPTLRTTNLALQLHWPQHSLSLNQANFGTPPMQLMVPRRRQLVICSSFKLNTIKMLYVLYNACIGTWAIRHLRP